MDTATEVRLAIESLVAREEIKVDEWVDELAIATYSPLALREISNRFYLSNMDLLAGAFCDNALETSHLFAQANVSPSTPT